MEQRRKGERRELTRDGGADEIIWCDVDPCYVFHPLNAYDAPDGTVVVDLCRYESMFRGDLRGPFGDSLATFDRWVIDPVADTKTPLFDIDRMRSELAAVLGHEPAYRGLPFDQITPLPGEGTARFEVEGRWFDVDLETYRISPAAGPSADST